MKIIGRAGREDIAYVYLAELDENKHVEFVESVQPPIPREKKWVLIVSTLFGCPVRCKICDAGGWYKGRLSKEEIFRQIDYLVMKRYPDKKIPADKFKIQFARMGEPSLNNNVLEVLEELPDHFDAPGLMPCISTVAPAKTDMFFSRLIEIKNRLYAGGKFQMQFSIHSTDRAIRDKFIPIKKWHLPQIAEYGERFYNDGDRKIALNFALAENSPIDSNILSEFFNPKLFLIKLTPVNPTITARQNGIKNILSSGTENSISRLVSSLKEKDFEVIVSVGELEENRIGSNCGQFVRSFLSNKSVSQTPIEDLPAYQYEILNC
jgi:23S rRNA (adenine2503-C2)-methyltransferase